MRDRGDRLAFVNREISAHGQGHLIYACIGGGSYSMGMKANTGYGWEAAGTKRDEFTFTQQCSLPFDPLSLSM